MDSPMLTFLFDIAPEAGHIRFTLELAVCLNNKGYEVRYTDTSDSVFTSGLIQKGIGRVIYPGDFRWFTPDLVLLDYQLTSKAFFYHRHHISYIYITVSFPGNLTGKKNGVPLLHLPPSDQVVTSSSARLEHLGVMLQEWKKESSLLVIAGLLHQEQESTRLFRFYRNLKRACAANHRYRFIVQSGDRELAQHLFPLPDNMFFYRLLDLRSVLPDCDLVLTSGELETLSECIRAGIPFLVYPSPGKETYRESTLSLPPGLDYEGDLEATPERFERQVTRLLQHKEEIRENAQQLYRTFEEKNRQLEHIIEDLTRYIKNRT